MTFIERLDLREAGPPERPSHIRIQRHIGEGVYLGNTLSDLLEGRHVQMIVVEMRNPQMSALAGLLKGTRVEITEAPSPAETCSVKPGITG